MINDPFLTLPITFYFDTVYYFYMLEQIIKHDERFDKISPTAWIVAYRRSLSDIPYSFDILEELKSNGFLDKVDDSLLRPDLAPQIEARYKIVDLYLKESGVKQILELASGLSPRGMAMSENQSVNYIEMDLPVMLNEKIKLIHRLKSKNKISDMPNLKFSPGNVLNMDDLLNATSSFDSSQKLAIINEGLMRYLTMDERVILARNIHELLTIFGGVWITPDISLKRIFENENIRDATHTQKVSNMTGADITGNRFEDKQHARHFFEELGFSVEQHSWLEVIHSLSSPNIVGISNNEVISMNKLPTLFVMSAIAD
jgi:O-methyltransferase involved in polyketide biosynthesis